MLLLARIALALFALVTPALAADPGRVMRYYQIPATSTHPALGVTVELLSMLTPKPTVGVILFAGAHGDVNYANGVPGPGLAQNFLVRNRISFAQKGVMVAVVDWGPSGVTEEQRLTQGHADIISSLIALIRKDPGHEVKSLWLVGTSSGTLSVGNAAARYPLQPVPPPSKVNAGRPDGVVLTSTETTVYDPGNGNTKCAKTIADVRPPISLINVPTSVVWNAQDKCGCSPGTNYPAVTVLKRLTPQVAFARQFNNVGDPTFADQCKALTAHGFLNIDNDVVTYIVDFVRSH